MLGISFLAFNLIEGVLWIVCAVVWTLLTRRSSFAGARSGGIAFALFGLSDIVEAYYPLSFLERGGEWLLLWKLACLSAIVFSLYHYVRSRIR